MESPSTNTFGTRLLPSDYIQQGGWCKGDLTRPIGWSRRKIGIHQRGSATPDGYEFCMTGAIIASAQDGYMTFEETLRYCRILEERIKPLLRNDYMRWVAHIYPTNNVRLDGWKDRITIPKRIAYYNDNLCDSGENVASVMMEVEEEMGLRFNRTSISAPSGVAGVRNVIEREREALVVNFRDSHLPATPRVEDAVV